MRRCFKRKSMGSISTEWAVGTLMITFFLFAPIDGEQSAIAHLIAAMDDSYKRISFSSSLP